MPSFEQSARTADSRSRRSQLEAASRRELRDARRSGTRMGTAPVRLSNGRTVNVTAHGFGAGR